MLADGTVLYGRCFGAPGIQVAEIVFNTSMSGYQEIMTDPSYRDQMVCFTHPHIGNVGINDGARQLWTPHCSCFSHFQACCINSREHRRLEVLAPQSRQLLDPCVLLQLNSSHLAQSSMHIHALMAFCYVQTAVVS